VKCVRTGQENTTTVNALVGDTIEYRLVLTNSGEVTGTNLILTDTVTFDAGINSNTMAYIYMDTATYADSWTYTTDPTFATWQPWGSTPPYGATNVKGLRWKFNTLGPGQQKQVKFRAQIK